jgi:rhodanese-related sulfurtransferase
MGRMSMQPSVPVVPAAEVADDAVMVDVREQDEWDAGHAPHAVHIPMGDLPARVGELPESVAPLAIVCRSGNRSGRVVAWLSQQGYDAVNVGGGMQQWSAAGKPMVSETPGSARVI